MSKFNYNPLIFTDDYIDSKCDNNEYALVIYSASRAKALHVGLPTHIQTKPADKVACTALLEIIHGFISTSQYKDGANHTLDSLIERVDSRDFDLMHEEDMYDTNEDDMSGSLSALNNTVFE